MGGAADQAHHRLLEHSLCCSPQWVLIILGLAVEIMMEAAMPLDLNMVMVIAASSQSGQDEVSHN